MGDDTKMAVRAVETGERKDRVLIVEDEDNARKGYEQLLQKWGCDVLGVSSAEDALAKFGNYQPDALIADVELPGMNGLDLLKQLGSDLLGVPAIVITGKGSEERAVAAIFTVEYVVRWAQSRYFDASCSMLNGRSGAPSGTSMRRIRRRPARRSICTSA